MLLWLLVCWCLVSVPVGAVVGRCIAAGDVRSPLHGTAAGADVRRVRLPPQRRVDASRVDAGTSSPASRGRGPAGPA